MSKMAKYFAMAAGMAALASGGDYMPDIPRIKRTPHSYISAAEMKQLKKRRKKDKAARKQRAKNRKKP